MRVTSIFVAAGLALFANAQTTVSSAGAAQSSAQAEVLRCLDACDPKDVNCRAKCTSVPFPNDSQANATNDCVAACPIGEGTEADNNAYTKCVSDCIGANYYTPSAGTPQPTGGASTGGNGDSDDSNDSNDDNSNDDSGNGDNTGNDDATGTDDGESTQTSDGPSPSESTGAASLVGASSGVVGVLGLVAAVMAL
jgi:hypothetical protein